MPNTCFAYGCNTGFKKEVERLKAEGKKSPALFRPPAGMLDDWRKHVPVRADSVFTQGSFICALHFRDTDIMTHWVHKTADGKEIKIERDRPQLAPQAIPCIFPNVPSYLVKPVKKRKLPAERNNSPIPPKKRAVFYREREPQWEDIVEKDSTTTEPSDGLNSNNIQLPSADSKTNSNLQQDYCVLKDAKAVKLPNKMWGVFEDQNQILFCHVSKDRQIDKCVEFNSTNTNSPAIFLRNKIHEMSNIEIKGRTDVETLLEKINIMKLCNGSEPLKYSNSCTVTLEEGKGKFNPGPKSGRCDSCRKKRDADKKRMKRNLEKSKRTPKMTPLARRGQQCRRLIKKLGKVENLLTNIQMKYKDLDQQKIDLITMNLPLKQKEMIKTCIQVAKAKSPSGQRYSPDWVYECILLRIKGPRLYRDMRRHKLLPLPHPRTLNRYMAKLSPSYGFDPNLFDMLKQKVELMTPAERHGSLLLDEMKLSEAISFNKSSLKVDGLVDLGKYTPSTQDKEMGDHALVLMFQPFRGAWVQAVGAFLSRGAAPGAVLEKIVLEGILLLEKAGLKVDSVVTDGGSWNRAMWKLFGISKKKCSCEHPMDPNRKLWFASDFPHLMKTMWSRVRTRKVLKTPDGTVKLAHWENMVKNDETRHIKRNAFLTQDHLEPKYYQSMNVHMAFTFFSGKVAATMKHYKDRGTPGFEDCAPTIAFIKIINNLADAMNSRLPWEALRPDKNSKCYKDIQAFISYLEEWEKLTTLPSRLSSQTHLGLLVTLRGTLELTNYLSEEVGYQYLMTRRLNQDALEHFFGIIRQSCGPNQHPDPIIFIQLYRLLSTHSLIKPPRGSNVAGAGGDKVKALLSLEDIHADANKAKKMEMEKELDLILDNGRFDILEPYFEISTGRDDIDPPALMNFTGYVVRKAKNSSIARSCSSCFETLLGQSVDNEDADLIECRSHGYLFVPSDLVMDIIFRLETAILNVIDRETISTHIIFAVLDEVAEMGISTRVGCEEHSHLLTKWVMDFYLKTRMIFACKRHMKVVESQKKKEKLLRKQSKL